MREAIRDAIRKRTHRESGRAHIHRAREGGAADGVECVHVATTNGDKPSQAPANGYSYSRARRLCAEWLRCVRIGAAAFRAVAAVLDAISKAKRRPERTLSKLF